MANWYLEFGHSTFNQTDIIWIFFANWYFQSGHSTWCHLEKGVFFWKLVFPIWTLQVPANRYYFLSNLYFQSGHLMSQKTDIFGNRFLDNWYFHASFHLIDIFASHNVTFSNLGLCSSDLISNRLFLPTAPWGVPFSLRHNV